LTTAKKINVSDDLRKQLSDIEDHQAALLTERDEISYLALVDRDKKAIERLNSINDELRVLTTRAETVQAALKEAVRRETAAQEEAAAEARRQNAREAELLCAGVESIAQKFDETLAALAQHAQDYENEMAKIRRLIGAGPTFDLVRIFLGRALRTSIMRTPLHQETIAPGDRVTVSAATATWMQNSRVHIGRTLNVKPAAQKAA
jgi:DNA repair exonuclease SbcCD ATPase subunit